MKKEVIYVLVIIGSFVAVAFLFNDSRRLLSDMPAIANDQNDNQSQTDVIDEEGEDTVNDISTKLNITINGINFTATLENNDTAKELVSRLPLDLTMNELNSNEKYYYFDEALPSNSSRVENVEAGDIMLYGDDCLVIFGDNCMDAWWQSGGIQNQVERRYHDLSDGFALIGFKSQPQRINNYSASSVQIRNNEGSAYIELSGNTINIVGNVNIKGGNTTIDGKIFLGHTHSGIMPGGSNTGGVS